MNSICGIYGLWGYGEDVPEQRQHGRTASELQGSRKQGLPRSGEALEKLRKKLSTFQEPVKYEVHEKRLSNNLKQCQLCGSMDFACKQIRFLGPGLGSRFLLSTFRDCPVMVGYYGDGWPDKQKDCLKVQEVYWLRDAYDNANSQHICCLGLRLRVQGSVKP